MDASIHQYIEKLVPERSSFFQEMEEYAQEHQIPIMEAAGIEALIQILRIQKPKAILEIGAAIGYSALRMADALPSTTIVTIERDEERYLLAEANIKKAQKGEQIKLIKGDALETVEAIGTYAPFDAMFIDAAKGQYKKFFELYSPYLADKGIIITDNVLFKGLVCETEFPSRRVRSLVKKINEYNQWIMNHPQFDTAILPVGDGVAISIKR